tara:strand:+ start:3318 stop:5183 length:1866 start_codon:yes stop_codon:yes gene_type:complete
MAGRTLDIADVIGEGDSTAYAIVNKYTEWDALRGPWLAECAEIRNYIFATDTTTTSNSKLPWRNSTTRPKLTQIRDNLEANYMSALFPNEEWLTWDSVDDNEEENAKKQAIEAYMRVKTQPSISPFRDTMGSFALDFIDYGNVFGTSEFVDETRRKVPLTAEVQAEQESLSADDIPGFVGPRAVRISPNDIVFNPLAPSFDDTPKIVRTVKSMGEVVKELEQRPEMQYNRIIVDLMKENRRQMSAVSSKDTLKSDGFIMDGFGGIQHYYGSGSVEILEFVGDFYDIHSDRLYTDHIITIADRMHVLRMVPNPSWRKNIIRHTGWRKRPDNLYHMGPLANLVGMQYRIDHLENMKADIFDQTVLPMAKIKGFVEDFVYEPGGRIYMGEDGNVEFERPDASVLQTNLEIQELESSMEIMAGAPKEAMGIRTPGEKTAFEVQKLDASSSRVYQRKITSLEIFMEHLLNDMLELARRNMSTKEAVGTLDNELGVIIFQAITKDDLAAKGRIYPIGARHFAAEANQLQNMVQFSNSALGQDPSVQTHFSGLGIAKAVEKLLSFEKFALVSRNIRVAENVETQQAMAIGQRQLSQDEGAEDLAAIEDEEADQGPPIDDEEELLNEDA